MQLSFAELAEAGTLKTSCIIWTTQDVWSEGHRRQGSHRGTSSCRQRSLRLKQPTPSHTEKGHPWWHIAAVVARFTCLTYILWFLTSLLSCLTQFRSGKLWKSMTQAAQQVEGRIAIMCSTTPACCSSPTWLQGQTTEKVKPWPQTSFSLVCWCTKGSPGLYYSYNVKVR